MKVKLEQYIGKTLRLTGIFNEITFAKAAGMYSVLIKPVYMNGHILCDHAWIAIPADNNPLKNLDINKMDEISFSATVEQYMKSGYVKEYGLKDMQCVSIVKKGSGRDYVDSIKSFSFPVQKEARMKVFGGESKLFKQVMDKPLMEGVYLKEGDEITCEFVRVHNGRLEFKLRTNTMKKNYWIKKVYFNPIKNGQTVSVRGYFSIVLPPQIYSDIKRAYFKIFCTKTDIAINQMVA